MFKFMYRSYRAFSVISSVCSDTVKLAGPALDWKRAIPVVYTECNVAQQMIVSDNGTIPMVLIFRVPPVFLT
jgi:hypothetical protein